MQRTEMYNTVDGDGMSAEKFAMSNRRANPSTYLSTPVASVTNQVSKLFCERNRPSKRDTRCNGPTNRLIIPVLPIHHLCKSLLDHKPNEFVFLFNLSWK